MNFGLNITPRLITKFHFRLSSNPLPMLTNTVNVRKPNVRFGKPNKKWFGFQHVPISDVRALKFIVVGIQTGVSNSILRRSVHSEWHIAHSNAVYTYIYIYKMVKASQFRFWILVIWTLRTVWYTDFIAFGFWTPRFQRFSLSIGNLIDPDYRDRIAF